MSKLINIMNKIIMVADNIFFGLRLTFLGSPLLTIAAGINYLLQRLMPILEAFALKEIINSIINSGSYDRILTWTGVFMISIILSKLLENIFFLIYTALERKTNHNFENKLIEKIVSCDLSFFDSSKDNDILNIVQQNNYVINNIVWRSLWILSNCISLITTFGILVMLDPIIAFITALCVVPEIILNQKYYDFIWNYDWKKSNDYRKMHNTYDVMCSKDIAEELRLYNNTDFFMERYFKFWHSWFNEKNKYGMQHNLRLFGANLLRAASIALSFIYCLLKFSAGILRIGDIQYYVNLTVQIENSFTNIFKTVSEMQVDSEKITVIREFFSWKPTIQSQGNLMPGCKPEIEFRNVSFRYPNTERYVLKNCSFKIGKGEKVAFVGLNGAGKSTIIKLILRFYDPNKGEILIDGINIKKYDLKGLRRVFGAQFQDYSTYLLSVKENVMLGDIQNRDEARVYDALVFSGADQFVNNYENGMETQVSRFFDDKGEELSGGQKQKLALSRAYYRNADIMILDEPSAALDPEAEYNIFRKFIDLWENRGAILISHRLSNVTLCDRIIVLDGCHIVEEGTHAELMRLNGKYAYLFKLQASKYLDKS